jgi:hypothetical protein
MKRIVFNQETCRLYGNRPGRASGSGAPKLTMHRSGKFTITDPLYKALGSEHVELILNEETGVLYIAPSTAEIGFKLRDDGKNNYKSFNSAGLYKALSQHCFKPADKKRVRSVSLEVNISDAANKMFSVNYEKPLYYTDEFNPDANEKTTK